MAEALKGKILLKQLEKARVESLTRRICSIEAKLKGLKEGTPEYNLFMIECESRRGGG